MKFMNLKLARKLKYVEKCKKEKIITYNIRIKKLFTVHKT